MQFMVYLRFAKGQAMAPPSPEGMQEMGRIMSEAFDAGMIVATGQLPGTATNVTLQGDQLAVAEGPAFWGNEFIPGFTIIEVESPTQATEWASQLRRCMGNGTIYVAPLKATSKEDIAPA